MAEKKLKKDRTDFGERKDVTTAEIMKGLLREKPPKEKVAEGNKSKWDKAKDR